MRGLCRLPSIQAAGPHGSPSLDCEKPMAWRLFHWGTRGFTYDTGGGVYVAFIPIPNCIQINLKGEDATGNELLHVFDVIKSGAPPVLSDCLLAANTVAAWWTSTFKAFTRTDLTANEVIATSRAVVNGPQATVIINQQGTRAGDTQPLPNAITVAVKKDAGQAGRSYRGRFYIWPFYYGDLDAAFPNLINPTFAGNIITAYDALTTALTAAGVPLGVASNVLGQINPITGLSLVDTTVDVQRRRLPGRGA